MKTFFFGGRSGRGLLAALLLGVAPGCYDVKSVDPGIEVLPDEVGRVDVGELGLRGQWFAYGDNYDYPQSCTNIGKHTDEECSVVSWPQALPVLRFPNENGVMCTLGSIGEQVPCGPGVLNCPENTVDYSNMWGAGIGLDFDLDLDLDASSGARDPKARAAWSAPAHRVAGVAFDFQALDNGDRGGPWLRVEFPMILPTGTPLPPGKGTAGLEPGDPTVVGGDKDSPGVDFPDQPTPSEEHPDGSPFWKAPGDWNRPPALLNSPVHVGHNEIRFNEVNGAPESHIPFDPKSLLGIQFHVPSFKADDPDPVVGEHFGYGFCISNFTFLRE